MNTETNDALRAVKTHLKKGGTYFDTLLEAAKKAVIDAITRSAVNMSIEEATKIGDDAGRQFLGHWVGGEDSEVPAVDPNNPLQKSVDGIPAPILHPSKEDNHDIPKEVRNSDGTPPPPPPGVPAALTSKEEAAQLNVTGTPENVELLKSVKEKSDKAAEAIVDSKKADATAKKK